MDGQGRRWAAVAAATAALALRCVPGPDGDSASSADSPGGDAAAPMTVSQAPTTAASISSAPPAGSASAAGSETASPPPAMVRLAAGIFLMGAPAARGNPEEKPAHEAIVAAFWLDRTEVKQSDYLRCVAAGACQAQRPVNPFCNAKLTGRDNHPANCIDLRQADAFCHWAGKRLPTEREWEYAAGGGSEHRRYSWGAEEPSRERACYYHAGGTCAVASYPAGAFGLYDMTGNVWEWTASEFRPYPSSPAPDPIVGSRRYVYRGGSWSRRFPKWMTTLLRNRYRPDELSAAIGVRCAKSIEPLDCPADTAPGAGHCERVRGQPLCEPGTQHDGQRCRPAGGSATPSRTADGGGAVAARGAGSHGPPSGGPPSGSAEAVRAITRSRTPKYDADCRKYWPTTPAAYLFQGGPDFPSRQPVLKAAGCKPRDMGQHWTSACCPG